MDVNDNESGQGSENDEFTTAAEVVKKLQEVLFVFFFFFVYFVAVYKNYLHFPFCLGVG